ncbi:TetR/AcrR family transcriptional regulator [Nocardiopsis lambiniae]|uniref:TetR/AcrR family transcriptional regulator n=1 Tax=Nocardiopsis lambiniae TaxID=3075539 RepID=A0ABU2M796_9ACTN|nr:TetR/AcrR family transcriptional regulator [Nocardiopsis sp. DSM 44743]MDT0328544.1 TetR/AcrR family transcriptional regulator [Nocardiopsis sp. DSM 44743]
MDRIVGVALDLVDEEGAEALTLRSLATRMQSSTATLYRHFSGRADLARCVVDAVFAEVRLDEALVETSTWDVSIAHIAENMFTVLERHRNVAPLILSEIPMGPHALRLRERCLSVLVTNGFTPLNALRAYATLARYVLGFAVQAASEAASSGAAYRIEGHGELDLPVTAYVQSVGPIALADEFHFGLELMMDGLRSRHARTPAP